MRTDQTPNTPRLAKRVSEEGAEYRYQEDPGSGGTPPTPVPKEHDKTVQNFFRGTGYGKL